MRATGAVPRGSKLTPREFQVLELMAFGLANKEIAERLVLSPRTVETHIDRILGKLNVSSRARAVAEAGRCGILGAERRDNLPFQLTSLLGRDRDVADVKALLEDNRLLTLTGSGGVGKTRLALRVGLELLDGYPDGVWFCDFSPVAEAGSVVKVVAKALGVRESADQTLSNAILRGLVRRSLLLIFDNCEHVLDAAAELADDIVHQSPRARILSTSRQALGIMGEVVVRVRSLSVPDVSSNLTAEAAIRYGAVALFADRARALDAQFMLTNDNAPVVGEICRRLDGIPLAIELAAARVNVVGVESLALSLNDRFKVLTAGGRTALPRHKTLAALVDWSYDRLSRRERDLFNRLGIFGGSFSMAAVGAICLDPEDLDVTETLVALVEKSMVAVQTDGTQERYRLLESTREYALHKLKASGERDALARLSAEYFRDLAVDADALYGVGSTAKWLARMEVDLDNYRSALAWGLGAGNDPLLAGELAGALERVWALTGLSTEARGWIDAALERIPTEDQPAIAARLWLAKARFLQGEPMRECAQRSLDLYRRAKHVRGAAYALRSLAYSLLQMGRVEEAHEAISRAIDGFSEEGHSAGVALCLSLQGVSAYNQGDYVSGRAFYLRAIAAFRALGDELATANALGNLAELEFADGQPQRALESVAESLAITSGRKHATDLAIVHNNIAAYRIALGELDEAHDAAREALRWAQPELNVWNMAVALQHLALLAALRGRPESAAKLLGYVDVQYDALALEREATEKWGHAKLLSLLNERFQPGELVAMLAAGSVWTEDRAIEEALEVRSFTDAAGGTKI